MMSVGLDGLAKLPVMAPVVLLIVNVSLLVSSGVVVTVIVLLAARMI